MRLFCLMISCLFFATGAFAMNPEGCGAGTCADCHSLTKSEATKILGNMVDKVIKVGESELPGTWMVEVEQNKNKLPIYIDYSKKYLITGNVIRISDRGNVTQESHARMNKVDLSRIPLDDALVMGNPNASKKVIVFTDPECPYCRKLHVEMKKAIQLDPGIAFYIKLFPLKMHPNAYNISKSIICADSMELLEVSFAKKPVPPATCDTPVVDQTLALVGELGIRSTPTLVLPNGLVAPGFKKAEDLVANINQNLAKTNTR